MSVQFSGYSGLQTPFQKTLLIGQTTWAISMFVQIADSTTTASELLNRSCLLFPIAETPYQGPNPTLAPYVTNLFLQKSFDPSLVMFAPSATAGHQTADAWTADVPAFASHHIVWGVKEPVAQNPDGSWPQAFMFFLDANFQTLPGGDVNPAGGLDYPGWDGEVAQPGFVADQNWALRIGNVNFMSYLPGRYPTANPSGSVGFNIKNVAIWHGFFPSQSDVIALRGQAKQPNQVGPPGSLVAWWKLNTTASGPVTDTDADLVNSANPGTYDLQVV